MQGQSIIDTGPDLMQWQTIHEKDAPELFHGTRFCSVSPTLERELLPGIASGCSSGRTDIFFSAQLPADERVGRGSREDDDTQTNTKIPAFIFDCEIVAVFEAKIEM